MRRRAKFYQFLASRSSPRIGAMSISRDHHRLSSRSFRAILSFSLSSVLNRPVIDALRSSPVALPAACLTRRRRSLADVTPDSFVACAFDRTRAWNKRNIVEIRCSCSAISLLSREMRKEGRLLRVSHLRPSSRASASSAAGRRRAFATRTICRYTRSSFLDASGMKEKERTGGGLSLSFSPVILRTRTVSIALAHRQEVSRGRGDFAGRINSITVSRCSRSASLLFLS